MKKVLLLASFLMALTAQVGSMAATAPVFDDTVIRVLFVIDSTSQLRKAEQSVLVLERTWAVTTFSAASAITLEVVDLGSPALKPGPRFSADKDDAIAELKAFVESPHSSNPNLSIRDFWGADIVIGLVQEIPGFNGYAPMDSWVRRSLLDFSGQEFIPNPLQAGLDRRGADEYYLAIIDEDAGNHVATHEFGHLLGAGHLETKNWWLRDDSHAYGFSVPFGHFITAVARTLNSFCNFNETTCTRLARFSDVSPSTGSPTQRNSKTIDITARSVANYRAPGPGSDDPPFPFPVPQCSDGEDNDGDELVDSADPDCSGAADDDESGPPPPPAPPACDPAAFTPTNVTASRLQRCVPGTSKTSYRVRWQHACPGGFYQVFATDSVRGTYFVTQTTSKSVVLTIAAPPGTGLVTIRACNFGFLCSPLSSPPVVLVDQC